MVYKIIGILFLGISISSATILAGTRDPSIPDNKYITFAKEFYYVGKLCGSYENGNKFCASAVAIDDHHILTAAHVVNNSSSCFFYLNDKKFCISQMTIHQDFSEDTFGSADIALGYSKESFDLDFYPALYTDDEEEHKVCTIAGYGFHGTFLTGGTSHDDKKRAGSNYIESVDDTHNMLICTASFSNDKNRTSLEFLIASGDSGGGLFIGNELAGINSCVMAVAKSPSSKYNEESGHTRVSKFISWINKHKTNE